jgi:superfamily I DNA and RNA helicase
MAEQDQGGMQDQGEGDVTEAPDYEALYKSSQEELEKAKENSRKWERRSKSNAEKAKAYEDLQGKSKTTEERLSALEEENKALKARSERAALVSKVAKVTGVSQEIVSTLSGTDDETLTAQAKAVAEAIKAAPRYPTVTDEGKPTGAKAMTEEEIEKIKNPRERVMARAAKIAQERRK